MKRHKALDQQNNKAIFQMIQLVLAYLFLQHFFAIVAAFCVLKKEDKDATSVLLCLLVPYIVILLALFDNRE